LPSCSCISHKSEGDGTAPVTDLPQSVTTAFGNVCKKIETHNQHTGALARLYRSFATTLSQLKICDFSGETFKGFEVL
jgi:hypothetical protein